MGKKMRKKAPNPRKAINRAPTGSPRSAGDRKGEVVVEHEGERGTCGHYSKSVDELNRILSSIRSASSIIVACEHCREEPVSKRGSKEKGKKQKKKGGGGGGGARVSESKKDSNFIWVCLDCNRCFCGGEVSVSEPYGHARRHSKQEHHMWAVRSDDPLISWCYLCGSAVPIEMPSEETEVAPKPAVDSESGVELVALETSKGYVVRGLSNLGNTCFFNSVMQNLLATDMLRDYLVRLDRPFGPITMALKKLFVETSYIGDSKNVLSPKALFGSICVKAPQFRGYQQQDSHELLRYLLDGLYAEEISDRKVQESADEKEEADPSPVVTFVDSIFGGQISSTVCCMECGHTSLVHEPFLDLSLPVPSKKPPPKKVPPPPPKRGKPPPKERNKGRRFRQKVVTKGSPVIQNKEESSDAPSECSKSVVPAQKPEEAVAAKVEDDFTWMDFCEAPVTQCSESEQVIQSESTTDDTLDSQLVDCSKDLNVPSDSCGEASCSNDVPASCSKDSNVLLLPYKEPDPTAEEINGTASWSQTAENVAAADAPAEADFDGFGDLFNEPEATSEPKTENGTGEELDLTLWTGDSSESNYDEVDSTNVPVSVNSCLALFTKPELLSDEQAWHCDRCSENARQMKGTLKVSRALDEGESRSEKPLPSVEVDYTEIKVSGNGKMISFSNKSCHQDEVPNDPSAEENTSQKPLNLIGRSDGREEIKNQGNSNLLSPDSQLKDEEIAASDDSSHYFSCQSSQENTPMQEKSFKQDNDSCSVNDRDSVGCDKPAVAVNSDTTYSTNKVNQLGKEGLQLLDKNCLLNSNGNEEVQSETKEVQSETKVMRDATKRILINRLPPILTIHLKRFSQNARGRLTKLSGHVSFQETLDLRPYLDPRSEDENKCHYRLIGVVEHSGTMHGGHYIAYVRGERGRSKILKTSGPAWFCISDAHVREASLPEVLNSDAYILFYERVQI